MKMKMKMSRVWMIFSGMVWLVVYESEEKDLCALLLLGLFLVYIMSAIVMWMFR